MTTAYVCRKCPGRGKVLRVLRRAPEVTVVKVGCQKICTRAVVGIRRDGATTWFHRVDSGKRRRALARFARAVPGGRVPKRLRKLQVVKRRRRDR